MTIIPVVGFDPSMNHWGVAEATLDLITGYLSTPVISVIEPIQPKGKQVRQNSIDLSRSEQLAHKAIEAAKRAKVVFAEVPVGSQSANGMKSYGMCVGVLGSIVSMGIPIIEVTATEVKLAITNKKTATKEQMIAAAIELYPESDWPRWRGEITAKAEHMADAIAAIHAGVHTPMFQNILRLYKE